MDLAEIFSKSDLYGIYDLETNEWILDCFDHISTFFSSESAEKYRTTCKDYNSPRYEVKLWRKKLT